MGKKTKTVEYDCCDFCDSDDDTYTKCLGCGKDVCYECKDLQCVKYNHALNVSGSKDGYYCDKCNATTQDDLHKAYMQMRSLKYEAKGFYADLERRAKETEKKIRDLRARAS